MKAYPALTPDYILYEMSYTNVALYSSIIPSYDEKKKKKDQDFDSSKDANNPDNFKTEQNEIIVKGRKS